MQTDTTTQTDPTELAAALGPSLAEGAAQTPEPSSVSDAPTTIPTAPRTQRRTARAATPVEPPPKLVDVVERQAVTPALRSFGAEVASKLSGADRLEIYKVTENGNEAIVPGNWPMATLGREPSAPSMLAKFIVPSYGGGRYHLFAVNGQNKRFDAGYYDVAEPVNVNPGQQRAEDPSAKYLHEHLQSRERELQETRAAERALQARELERLGQPQPRMLDQLRELHESAALLGLKGEKADQYVQGLIQAQTQRPTTDPATAIMLERLSMRLEALSEKMAHQASQASMPMPPPPPPPDPMASIMPLLAQMQASNDRNMNLVLQLIAQPKETFGMKDVVALVTEMRPPKEEGFTAEKALGFMKDAMQIVKPEPKETSDFKGRMNEMFMMMKFSRMMSGGDGGSSFNDVLMQLVNAQPGSLGYGVMKRIAEEKAATKRLPANAAPKQPAPRQPTANAAARTPPAPPPAASVAPPAEEVPQQAAERETAEPAAPQQKQPKQPPPFPEGTHAAVAKIEQAEGDERVGALMGFLQFLGTTDWLPFVQALLRRAVSDERLNTLKILSRLLGRLVHEQMLTAGAAKATLAVVEQHWGKIVEALRTDMEQRAQANGPEDEEDGGEESDDDDEPAGPAPDSIVDLPPELEGEEPEPDIIVA